MSLSSSQIFNLKRKSNLLQNSLNENLKILRNPSVPAEATNRHQGSGETAPDFINSDDPIE